MTDSAKWEKERGRAGQGRAGVCVADQRQLYSSISEMKIATPVKVEVFTKRRTRGGKRNKEGELCNPRCPGKWLVGNLCVFFCFVFLLCCV